MGQLRDRNAVLMPNEIEAIKVTQEVIKRMTDNSAKTKTVFLALFAAAVTLHKSITMDAFVFLGMASVIVCLWYTDAKYLQLERQFRMHHQAIINGTVGYLDQWKLNPAAYKTEPVPKIMFCNFTMFIYWLSGLFLLKLGIVG